MTNREIIQTQSALKGFNYDGQNLFTYAEWKSRGYMIQKGQHAFISCRLWKKITKTNKTTGKTETNFYLIPSYLFTADQVKESRILQLTAK